jgi:nitrous oxide reductase
MKHFNDLSNHIQNLKDDFEKYYEKNNLAAGTRIRKGLQTLKQMAHKLRIEIQDEKNVAKSSKPVNATTKN